MPGIWETKYCVIDVETTGSDPENNRLIEIACVTMQGAEIVSTFSSLINPHQFIPHFIQKMTGISNERVFTAPEECEVLPIIKEIFLQDNTVFVAHNASFDHSFVYHSFARCGIEMPEIPKLCTLKLARRLLPHNIKKNVGSLAQFFNINLTNRHRALGDAEATAKSLAEMLDIASLNHSIMSLDELIKFHNKPVKRYSPGTKVLDRLQPFVDAMPQTPGVYYFKSTNGTVLYVGKAMVLKERVKSYFSQEAMKSKKIVDMLKKSSEITFQETETELGALLLETKEIKKYMPAFNVMEKCYQNLPFLKISAIEPYPRLEIADTIENDNAEYYGPFRSAYLIKTVISIIEKSFRLRKCEIMPKPENARSCLYYHIEKCIAPCTNSNAGQEYQQELAKVRSFLSGNAEGILSRIEREMAICSSYLEFEKASILKNHLIELQKLFKNKIEMPASVTESNYILFLPASAREKTVEIFLIRYGKLFHQEIIGRKAPLFSLLSAVHNAYFNGLLEAEAYTKDDINEMKIICSWIFKHSDNFTYLFISNKTESKIQEEIQKALRNISFPGEKSTDKIYFD